MYCPSRLQYFNSMIVRLKVRAGLQAIPRRRHFNSMIVRLKAPPVWSFFLYGVGFQFYDSPIKRIIKFFRFI